MAESIIKPLPVSRIVRAIALDLDTLVAMGREDSCTAASDGYFCDLPTSHDGPHEARVPALVTVRVWEPSGSSIEAGAQ